MALSNQELSEAAMKIRERLTMLSASRYSELSTKLEAILGSMERLQTLDRRLRICTSRNWFAAVDEVRSRLTDSLGWLARDVAKLQDAANRFDISIPSAPELVDELREAQREFGQLCYDRKNQTVGAVTEAIELAGVFLGEFEIRLLLTGQGNSHNQQEMYQIVALDPHPAGCDETVTHPHVRDESLCAGEAGAAIRSALIGGRICDFFLLVRSVLKEYNPRSPFVPLARWEGAGCHDCGSTMGNGEVCCCASCENDFCDECMSYCRGCDNSYCQECLTTCTACEEVMCSNCLTRCPDCRRAICKTCLEENRCLCKQEKEDQDGSNDTNRTQDDRTESETQAQLQTS